MSLRVIERKKASVPTALFACFDVDLVVSSPVVRDPFDGRRKLRDKFPVEDTDTVRGDVVSVNADDAVVFPLLTEAP